MKNYFAAFLFLVSFASSCAHGYLDSSNKDWKKRQIFEKSQFGRSDTTLHKEKGFYFFEPFLDRFKSLDSQFIERGLDSYYHWKKGYTPLYIDDWTVIPDDLITPLGLVKVRWVKENNSYDKSISIVTQNFSCRQLTESNTCFKVDLILDFPRKFVKREYFDRLLTWDITAVANGNYRLKLYWQNGSLLSPVFTIQHSAALSP